MNPINNSSQPFVSVVMITYNHDKFIAEAINGVLMQQCNFNIELIVANDSSVDKTDDIIQNYLTNNSNSSCIRYFRQSNNVGMTANFIFALNQCKGKYIAFCEGDDYWTDPFKLQKQVDFLENNLTYSVCWTKYEILEQDVLKKVEVFTRTEFNIGKYDVTLDSIFDPYVVHTATCLFRNKTNFSVWHSLNYAKDNTIFILLLLDGKGAILDFESAVYRQHPGGIYSSKTELKNITDNYYNLKEINSVLLKHKISRLKQVERSFLYMMFYLMCNSSVNGFNKAKAILKIYFKIIGSSPWRTKYWASKDILKQIYLRLKPGS